MLIRSIPFKRIVFRCSFYHFVFLMFIGILSSTLMNNVSFASTTPQVAAGWTHTVALKSDGSVWAWGGNSFLQLGDGTDLPSYTPTQTNGISDVIAISCGEYHSMALKSDGTVWTWGSNPYGQLGEGTDYSAWIPKQVSALSNIIAIASGEGHSLALKNDGTVWAWGRNYYGTLGDGTNTDSNTPIQVSGLSGVSAIASGTTYSFALKSDGTVWAWGNNSYGQLGDGTYTSSNIPVQVSSLSGVIAITGGDGHSLALKSDGTVWGWGNNVLGQLGDGTSGYYNYKTAPQQFNGISDVVAISAGGYHTILLKSDGTAWGCGYNYDGELGDGTSTNQTTLIQITALNSISSSACGFYYTVFLKSDGTVWTCGENSSGQLGDGTKSSKNTPVQVNINLYETSQPPAVTTNTATNVTESTVTLNGTVNANGESTTAWFEYGATSGTYSNTTSTQSVSGSGDTSVSASISGLSPSTTYYYRIVAQNSAGTSYGSEVSFTTSATSSVFVVTESLMTGISSDEFHDEYDGCQTPPEKATFYDTDSHAMVWFHYENADGNDTFKWEWYTPDSDLYGESDATATYTNGCWMSYIYISGYSAARKPGNWSVKVYRNDEIIFTETFTIVSTDTTAPSGSININNGDAYTKTTSVTLSLSATDSTGVTGYYISTSSSTPSSSDSSWVSVSSTISYSGSVSYTLSSGDGSKTIYVWYKDAAGNVSGTASNSITLDATAPTVSITSPTSDTTYSTTSSTISLSGSTSDSTSGVSSVAWSNSTTGSSGTASGTTSWSVSSISLSSGSNSITVTATDNAGNTSTDSITVTYSVAQLTPTPTTLPSSCTDDYEPNDDFQNAYGPLESGKSYEGKLCSSEDKDYFRFELENPNTIQLTLNVPSGNDYDLYLYDSSETEISNSRTTEETETITHNAASTGIYYIQVFGYGGAYDEDFPYILAGTWTASFVPTPTSTPTSVVSPVPNPTGTPAETGVIIGSVINAATSEPIAGATVSTDDGAYSATTNPAGRFTMSDIPTGNYTLTASATGYESTSQPITVTAGAPTQANFSLNSLLSPSPTPVVSDLCEVYGFVTDEDYHDLSEVNITIEGKKKVKTKTDGDGYFEFTGLKAGKYTVTYEKEGYRKQSENITLTEGESLDLGVIVMEQNIAGSIYGTVIDAENDPIESVKIKLKGKGSNAKVKEKYTTDEDGSYEFTDLEEGTYIIQAKKKGYQKAKERVKLSDGEDKEVDLVVEEK